MAVTRPMAPGGFRARAPPKADARRALARVTSPTTTLPPASHRPPRARTRTRSRRSTPKHVRPVGGPGRPLLREPYERASSVGDEVFVLTETREREIIEAVLPESDAEQLIRDPSARGPTNAYGLAALTLMARD